MCMDCVTGEEACQARSLHWSVFLRPLWSRTCFHQTFRKQLPFVFRCHSVSCLTPWNFLKTAYNTFCGDTSLRKPWASGREWVLGLLVPLFHGKRWHSPWVAGAKECSQYTISSLDYSTRSWWYPLALDVVVLVLKGHLAVVGVCLSTTDKGSQQPDI